MSIVRGGKEVNRLGLRKWQLPSALHFTKDEKDGVNFALADARGSYA